MPHEHVSCWDPSTPNKENCELLAIVQKELQHWVKQNESNPHTSNYIFRWKPYFRYTAIGVYNLRSTF